MFIHSLKLIDIHLYFFGFYQFHVQSILDTATGKRGLENRCEKHRTRLNSHPPIYPRATTLTGL